MCTLTYSNNKVYNFCYIVFRVLMRLPMSNSRIPLHDAIIIGSEDGVRYLIGLGHDINEQDEFGNSAVTRCVDGGRWEILKILIDNDVDVNVTNSRGELAINCARDLKNTKIINLLEAALVKQSNQTKLPSDEEKEGAFKKESNVDFDSIISQRFFETTNTKKSKSTDTGPSTKEKIHLANLILH